MWLLGSGQHFKAQTQHDTVTCHSKLREWLLSKWHRTSMKHTFLLWYISRKMIKRIKKIQVCVTFRAESVSLTVWAAIRESKEPAERNLSAGQRAYQENMPESEGEKKHILFHNTTERYNLTETQDKRPTFTQKRLKVFPAKRLNVCISRRLHKPFCKLSHHFMSYFSVHFIATCFF